MVQYSLIVTLDLLAFAAAVTMTIAAFRAHKALSTRQSLAFLACFSLISIGLFFSTVVDTLIDTAPQYASILAGLSPLALSHRLVVLVAALAVLSGYTLLFLAVENIKNRSVWLLVFLLVLFTVFLANDLFLMTHVLAIVLLALLAHRFWLNFLRRNSTNALIVYGAFLSLLAAHVAALFVPLSSVIHVVFLVLRVVGYFLLFAVSWRVSHA